MTPLTIALRLLTGIGIVAAVVYAGYQHRSPWIIGPLSVAFAVMYVVGKPAIFSRLGPLKILAASIMSIPPQVLVVGVLYLVGFGLGSLISSSVGTQEFGRWDWTFAGWVFVLGGFCGGLASVLEARNGLSELDLDPEAYMERLLSEHMDDDDDDDDGGEGEGDATWTLEAAADEVSARTMLLPGGTDAPGGATEEEIQAAEERLGLRLPESLRAVYREQDGGRTGFLVVPTRPEAELIVDDQRSAFPSERLSALAELTTLDGNRDRPVAPFRDDDFELLADTKSLLVLSWSGSQFTLLDYSKSDVASVHVHNFDPLSDAENCVTFASFDAFLDAMTRVEE